MITYHNVFNVWPRDTERLDTPDCCIRTMKYEKKWTSLIKDGVVGEEDNQSETTGRRSWPVKRAG